MNTEQTCAVCFRKIKTKNNHIWSHGYTNNVLRMGTCYGSDLPSFEISKKGSQKYLLKIRQLRQNLHKVIEDNKVNKTLKNSELKKIRNEAFALYIAKGTILKKLKERGL